MQQLSGDKLNTPRIVTSKEHDEWLHPDRTNVDIIRQQARAALERRRANAGQVMIRYGLFVLLCCMNFVTDSNSSSNIGSKTANTEYTTIFIVPSRYHAR